MGLRKFRGSNFLRSSARRLIGDFGVPIAILVFVLVDATLGDVYTEKLAVPNAIEVKGIYPTDMVSLRFYFRKILFPFKTVLIVTV